MHPGQKISGAQQNMLRTVTSVERYQKIFSIYRKSFLSHERAKSEVHGFFFVAMHAIKQSGRLFWSSIRTVDYSRQIVPGKQKNLRRFF